MILEGGSEHVLSEETTEKLQVFAGERGLNVGKPVHIGLIFYALNCVSLMLYLKIMQIHYFHLKLLLKIHLIYLKYICFSCYFLPKKVKLHIKYTISIA